MESRDMMDAHPYNIFARAFLKEDGVAEVLKIHFACPQLA